MDVSALVTALALAWIVGIGCTHLTRRFASTIGLVDKPNKRSSHITPTPSGGGVGFALGGSLAMFLVPHTDSELWLVIALAGLIAAVGLRDDIRHVRRRVRFIVQVGGIATLLILLGFVEKSDPHVSVVLLLAGVWWINLFNFMDGIDGIAATQALFMLLSAATLALWRHPDVTSSAEWSWMLVIVAAVVGFLAFNWPPASIFMGDVGSTWLPFVIFALGLASWRDMWLPSHTWLILGGIFVADSTATLLRRAVRGDRWWEPHRSHAYQQLVKRWTVHRRVTLLAVAVNIMWVAPFAVASVVWPDSGWYIAVFAYVPLVIGAFMLGAGASEGTPHISPK
jgi:Fuc2NAc and GlcNAc transferase